MKLTRIRTLEQLSLLAHQKRAVVSKWGSAFSHKHKPASWVIHLSGVMLVRMFRQGLYVYTQKTKAKPKIKHVPLV